MKNINEFRIEKASYLLEDKAGGKLRIKVDYKGNKFATIVLVEGENINKLKSQAKVVARDMLARKAQKNLVEKLLQLKI